MEREMERQREREMEPALYYDYERRFITQHLERDRMDILPRVVKPAMFSKMGHPLGDVRVFDRFTVAPISMLTCSFIELAPGGSTVKHRHIPASIVFILEGKGRCIQDGVSVDFGAEDLLAIPPYTTHQILADAGTAVRAWQPEVRLWHVLGLLWREQWDFPQVPEGAEPLYDAKGNVNGFKVKKGILGLERDLEVRAGPNKKREEFFAARRRLTKAPEGNTLYDYFLKLLPQENDGEKKSIRVIRGKDKPWEDTRQGRLKFYIDHWTDIAAKAMDLYAQEIPARSSSGKHRHIFEEMVLVTQGKGHDIQDEARYDWEAGDLICVPAMSAHQHFNDGRTKARFISVWSRQAAHEFIGGIEQVEDAPGYKG